MTRQRYNWRMLMVSAVIFAVLAGLSVRLAFLHLGSNDRRRSLVQGMRHTEKEILIGRGRILDRNGGILAIDLPSNDVSANARVIHEQGHVQFTAGHLARVLQMDPAVVLARLGDANDPYVPIKRFVPKPTSERLSNLNLPGVQFDPIPSRNYPLKQLAGHVVGFSNWEGVGSAGVEQHFDRYLKGRPGFRISERDGRRRELYDRRTLDIAPQAGSDVFLTIDQNVQFIAEDALDRAMAKHNAKGAWAIVQHIRTGEILAMASRPAYDLNEFRLSKEDDRLNRAIGYVYEPGSTFKLAVIAAALDRGLAYPLETIDCEKGMWYHAGRPLRDYHAYDKLTVQDVLKKSSNIGAAKLAIRLGDEGLYDAMSAFGFGQSTGLEVPGEEGGIFRPNRRWTKISSSRIAMGHEVAVTSLQMLNAVCAIANKGFLMKPSLVRRVVNARGQAVFESTPEVLSRPISTETAQLMARLMARVTEDGGTGRKARVPGYTVAGKTGTAQKPVAGGYSDSANMASFVGFVPAEDPEIGVIVVVDEPQPLHTGGAVAAPVFKEIVEEVLRYLDIPPVTVG